MKTFPFLFLSFSPLLPPRHTPHAAGEGQLTMKYRLSFELNKQQPIESTERGRGRARGRDY